MRQAKRDWENRTGRIGKEEWDRQSMTDRQDRQNWTGRPGNEECVADSHIKVNPDYFELVVSH